MRLLLTFLLMASLSGLASDPPGEPRKPLGCGPLASRLRSFTPRSFFSNTRSNGRPRFVMPVGIPGSGKTHWVNEARTAGWLVLSLDELRIKQLTQKLAAEEKIVVDGEKVMPDPRNAKHMAAMTELAVKDLDEQMALGMRTGRPMVLDATNVSRTRVRHLKLARDAGYQTEALVFPIKDPRVQLENLTARAAKGGVDLLLDETQGDSDKQRYEILQKLTDVLSFNPVRTEPRPHPSDPRAIDDYFDSRVTLSTERWALRPEQKEMEPTLLAEMNGIALEKFSLRGPSNLIGIAFNKPTERKLALLLEKWTGSPLVQGKRPFVTLLSKAEVATLRKAFGTVKAMNDALRQATEETSILGQPLKAEMISFDGNQVYLNRSVGVPFRTRVFALANQAAVQKSLPPISLRPDSQFPRIQFLP